MTTAIILAAGKGKRLRPFTHFIPKPLIPFMGQSIIEYVMEMLSKSGVYKYFINIHHKPMQMINKLGDQALFFYERELLGGAETVRALIPYMSDNFIVCNADTISNVDIIEMMKLHKISKSMATVLWDRKKNKGAGLTILNTKIYPYLKSNHLGVGLQDTLMDIGFSKYEQKGLWWFDLGTFKGYIDAYKFLKNYYV